MDIGNRRFAQIAAAVFGAAAFGPAPQPAAAEAVTANFISGTYAMEGRCEKLAKIKAGGDQNVETVPETLTSDGFNSWEGGCSFLSLEEKTKGRVWIAKMACVQEAEEFDETDTFELNPEDHSIKVTVDGDVSKYIRCDDEKRN